MTSTATLYAIASQPSLASAVQAEIRAMERAHDDAIASGGALLAKMISASRAAPHLRESTRHSIIETTVASLQAQVDARRLTLKAHGGLRRALGQIDVQELGWGDLDKSPNDAIEQEA